MATATGAPPAEVWLPVPGFPAYEASSAGRIRRATGGRGARAGHVLRQPVGSHGYPVLNLRHDGRSRQHLVHRLVAAAFLGPCPSGHEVNHRNGVKTDAAPSNLEYGTRQHNIDHARDTGLLRRGDNHPNAKLTRREVHAIRGLRGRVSQRRLAAMYGVSQAAICRATLGENWASA